MKQELTQNLSKSSPTRIFSSVRFRILAWYFLLTTCTVLISLGVTRQIFCNFLKNRTQEALVAEVSKFERLIEPQVVNENTSAAPQLKAIIEDILPLHVSARNEYIFVLINGEIVNSNNMPLQTVTENSQLIAEWAKVSDLTYDELIVSNGPIYYVANPLEITEIKTVVIAIRDAREDYQTGTRIILLVIKVTTVVSTFFFASAWITAGQVLSPLRKLTEMARAISQTDMSKRILVTGNDEIAELSATFNAMLEVLSSGKIPY